MWSLGGKYSVIIIVIGRYHEAFMRSDAIVRDAELHCGCTFFSAAPDNALTSQKLSRHAQRRKSRGCGVSFPLNDVSLHSGGVILRSSDPDMRETCAGQSGYI